jgi:aerobic-type carbon monoxide dehydrogenase small subunit (CoxS/CutS family)
MVGPGRVKEMTFHPDSPLVAMLSEEIWIWDFSKGKGSVRGHPCRVYRNGESTDCALSDMRNRKRKTGTFASYARLFCAMEKLV